MKYNKAEMRQYQKARRVKAAEQGMCTQCCARPASSGFVTCSICREAAKIRGRSYRKGYGETKPVQPITCPICGTIPDMFYWHHWDDSHPELGMWVCPYCNLIVELEDKGLVDRYRELKDEETHKFNNIVLEETLNLRYLA